MYKIPNMKKEILTNFITGKKNIWTFSSTNRRQLSPPEKKNKRKKKNSVSRSSTYQYVLLFGTTMEALHFRSHE